MSLPSKGRPALWLVVSLVFAVSLLFASLLFAASAHAQGTNAPESTTEAPAAEAAPESGVPPEQTTPPASEQASSKGEQAPPATGQTPPASEETDLTVEQQQPSDEREQSLSATEELVPPAEQTAPVAEDPPSTSEQTPPAAEKPPPTSEPTPPVTEQTPSTGGKAPPILEEALPAHEQETTEKQAGKAGGEAISEERAIEGTGDSQTSAGASGTDHKEPTNEVVPASSPAATTSDTAMTMSVISMLAGASQTPITLESPASSARGQARQVGRELAAFGASTIATGSVSRWLDTPETSSVSTIALAAIDASPIAMIATGVLARNRDGGSAIENHTSGPSPGPAPGGTGGGSAAGAGSGAASSASSMLIYALLQAVPNAMLRLCVSQPSWQTSFFALIPERPG